MRAIAPSMPVEKFDLALSLLLGQHGVIL